MVTPVSSSDYDAVATGVRLRSGPRRARAGQSRSGSGWPIRHGRARNEPSRTRDAWTSSFFGTQPTLTQVPPTALRSQRTTLSPCVCARRAAAMPPDRRPMMARSMGVGGSNMGFLLRVYHCRWVGWRSAREQGGSDRWRVATSGRTAFKGRIQRIRAAQRVQRQTRRPRGSCAPRPRSGASRWRSTVASGWPCRRRSSGGPVRPAPHASIAGWTKRRGVVSGVCAESHASFSAAALRSVKSPAGPAVPAQPPRLADSGLPPRSSRPPAIQAM